MKNIPVVKVVYFILTKSIFQKNFLSGLLFNYRFGTHIALQGIMKTYLIAAIFILSAVSGKMYAQAPAGGADTLYTGELKEVYVQARWKNDTERYKYNQMKFYVKTILPYLNASVQLFKDINAKSSDENASRKDKRNYINAKEDEMRSQFEDKIKLLNVTQGVLLVKLIVRQTDLNIYKGLREFKNPLVAIKWQSWALVNGMNLDRKYHPEDEPDLENIMYELGYPLPASYAGR